MVRTGSLLSKEDLQLEKLRALAAHRAEIEKKALAKDSQHERMTLQG